MARQTRTALDRAKADLKAAEARQVLATKRADRATTDAAARAAKAEEEKNRAIATLTDVNREVTAYRQLVDTLTAKDEGKHVHTVTGTEVSAAPSDSSHVKVVDGADSDAKR